jgi:hypothetical protein
VARPCQISADFSALSRGRLDGTPSRSRSSIHLGGTVVNGPSRASYLATIPGSAKIIAAVVLPAPGLPRLKEWAYAGVVINMLRAISSQVAMHQPIGGLIAPAVFARPAIASWASRPPTRRL